MNKIWRSNNGRWLLRDGKLYQLMTQNGVDVEVEMNNLNDLERAFVNLMAEIVGEE